MPVRATASGLQVVTIGRELAFFCRVCGKQFYEDEERGYTNHVVSCAAANEDVLRQRDLGEQMPGLFGPGAGDVEKKDWYRERKGWRI